MLSSEHLTTFLAIVETGSLARAADRVGRSQSAISMQLQKLESRVGSRLLERDAHSIGLTESGKILLQHAQRFRNLNEETWSALTEPLLEGRVRLGIPDDYALSLLPPILEAFASRHPKVAVELVCEQSDMLYEALASNRIDLAVYTSSDTRPGTILRYEPLVWVAPPRARAEENDPLSLALYQDGSLDRQYALQALDAAGWRYRIAYSSPSIAGQLAALRAGLAIAVMTRCSVPEDLRILGLETGLPALPPLEVAVSMATGLQNPSVQRLHDEITLALSAVETHLPENSAAGRNMS